MACVNGFNNIPIMTHLLYSESFSTRITIGGACYASRLTYATECLPHKENDRVKKNVEAH